MSIRKANAVWRGTLKEGKGSISTPSGVLHDSVYDFGRRFGDVPGTNPEELIAAAHASCFSMALSAELAKDHLTADSIETSAAVTLEMLEKGPTVTKIHLEVVGHVPGASAESFAKAADSAKANCPISRLLGAAAQITMAATLK